MRKLMLFVFVILLSTNVFGLFDESKEVANRIEELTSGKDNIIIKGENISTSEKIAFEYFQENYPKISKSKVFSDVNFTYVGEENVFLIGGPSQNIVTRSILSKYFGSFTEEKIGYAMILFSEEIDGKKYVIFSDFSGFNNLIKTSAKNSPLVKFIPVEYVPIAATVVGFSFLWFWKFLIGIINRVFRLSLSDKIMSKVKKKKFKEKYLGYKILGLRLKVREWTSIFFSATVFALAISYAYFREGSFWLSFLLMNILVNFIIYAVRNLIRLYFDKKYKIHTEYTFWHWGAIVTICSGWLGNTFALAGYIVRDESRCGKGPKIQYIINLFSLLFAVILFFVNMFFPFTIIQMAMILSLSLSFIQMLPISPFSGKKIYQWNKLLWLLLFIPLFLFYAVLSFLF